MLSSNLKNRVETTQSYDFYQGRTKSPSRNVGSTPTRSPARTITTETAIATRTRSRTRSKSPLRLRDSAASHHAHLFEEETHYQTYQEVYQAPFPKKSERSFFKIKKVTFTSLFLFSLLMTELACLMLLNFPLAPYFSHNLFTYLRTQAYICAVPLLLGIPSLIYVGNPTAHLWFSGLNALFGLINLYWFHTTYALWNSCDPQLLPAQEVDQCRDFKQWFINLRGFSVLLYGEQIVRFLFSAYQTYLYFNKSRQTKETKRVQTKSNLMFLLPSITLTLIELYFLWGLQNDYTFMTHSNSMFGKPLFHTDIPKYLGFDVSVLCSIAGLSLLFFGLCVVFKKTGYLFLVGQTSILVLTLLSVAYEEMNWDIFRSENIESPETYSSHLIWFKKLEFFAFMLIASQLANAVAIGVSIFNVLLDLIEQKKVEEDPVVDRLVFSHNEVDILGL